MVHQHETTQNTPTSTIMEEPNNPKPAPENNGLPDDPEARMLETIRAETQNFYQEEEIREKYEDHIKRNSKESNN